jgi:hypothetical protein
MEREELSGSNDARDLMFLFGGAALIMIGAGLILSNPHVQRYLGGVDINALAKGALPDFERYLKLRSM